MGSASITLDVTDDLGKKCKAALQWKGHQADVDRLVAEMDNMAYAKGVAPDHLALSTAFQLPTIARHGLKRFTNVLLYWVFSLPTNDPSRSGTFFDYVAEADVSIDVSIVARNVRVSSSFLGHSQPKPASD